MSFLRLLILALLTVSAFLSSLNGAWTDPGTTIDGTNQIILVVEPAEVDLLEYNTELQFEDVEGLPYCSFSSTGQTPCRDRPNFFTAVDYDSDSQTFHTLTDRGPVVDCVQYPSPSTDENVIGQPNTEGYFVAGYTPVLTSFMVDNSQMFNYRYQQLVDSQDPGYDGNNDGLPDAVDVNGDGIGDVNLPLSGLAKTDDAPKIYGPSCSSDGDYPLSPDPAGLAPSGVRRIVVNGTVYFIAIEEYGPSILVMTEEGKVLKAYVPENTPENQHGKYEVERSLPSIMSSSQFTRSFQSLSIDMSTSTLYVFLEATLSSPTISSSSSSSSLIRVLSFDISDINSIEYKSMYAFLLDSVKHSIHENEIQADEISHWSLVASDHIEGMNFLLVEENLQRPGDSNYIYLDLSMATDLKQFYGSDLQLEEISGQNNLLLVDDQPLNDHMVTNFEDLARPVTLGSSFYLFSSEDLGTWNDYSLKNMSIRSIRVLSPSTLVIGTSNNWGYTHSEETSAKLYFVRLSNEFVLVNEEPMAGVAGNGLILSDSSSGIDLRQQTKLWASIEESDQMEWESLEDMFTVELWVYWRGGALDQNTQVVVARGEGSWETTHFAILYETTGVASEAVVRVVAGCGNDVAFDYNGGSVLFVNEWHHIALVISQENSELYIDGALSGSGFYSGGCFDNSTLQYQSTDDNHKVLLGTYGDEYGFNGQVDELRLWSVVRTDSQISSWMRKVQDPYEMTDLEGLVAYYQFNDVPNSQKYEYGYQYFASSGPESGPKGLIMPDHTDKSRFVASSGLELNVFYSVMAVDEMSSPYQNVVHLTSSNPEHIDNLVYEITEVSPSIANLLSQESADEYIKFAQPDNSLDLTTLPVTLDSSKFTVFVYCNSTYDPVCSSLPSQEDLWIRYSVKSSDSSEATSSALVYLSVQMCDEIDECGVCMGDNSQCQCGCYHGFTSPYMDYKMFTFLLDENIAKIYDVLQTLGEIQDRVLYRWQGGYQYADYTKYLYEQKRFTSMCLDPFCDVFNPFEEEFQSNLPEFWAADTDFDTCQCSQEGPETDVLPPLYTDPTMVMM